MKKRLLALCLVICMVLGMLPVTAFAADPSDSNGILELTVTSMGLASNKYNTGTVTVGTVDLDYTQIANYGDGLQMRDKDGKTSILFNTSALPGGITKIELTYSTTKDVTYSNANAVIFSFGDAQDNLTYTTKLSTTAGVKSYTITPDSDSYTYFKLEHDLGFTMYWDSIKIYYESASTDPDAPVCEHTNTTTETVAATCTEAGSTTVKCDDCGETVSTTTIKALGHSYGEASEKDGNYVATCGTCGDEVKYEILSVTAASAKGSEQASNAYTTEKYCVTGMVVVVESTTHGNMYIQDAQGNQLYIYGLYSADGADRYDAMDPKPVAGDTITVIGVLGNFNGTAQMKSAWMLKLVKSTCEHTNTRVEGAVAATCTEDGATGKTFCADCNLLLAKSEIIPAAHIFDGKICTVCGEEKVVGYELTDLADITAAHQVIITVRAPDGTVYAMSSANGSAKAPAAIVVEPVGGIIPLEEAVSDTLWNIVATENGYIIYPAGSTETWLYCTATNNGVRVGTEAANVFVIDATTGYLKHSGTGRYLGVYLTNPDWRCYTNTTGNTKDQVLGFYAYLPCTHANTTTTTVEATCTATGSVTVTCDDCGETLSTTEIAATGHTYVDGVCACGEFEPGTEANPIPVTFTMNEEFTEGTATVTVPAGTTYYYQTFGIGGMELTINDGEPSLMAGNPRMPVVFPVTNDGEEEAEFVLTVTYPVGSQMNPVELQMGYNYATINAGNNQGFYYNWTAPANGTLTLSFSAEDADWNPCGWSYVVNNMTSYAYGDMQRSDSDPVVNPAVITVKAGDEIQLIVNAYDPADPWNTPAADLYTEASFECEIHGAGEYEDNYDNATHDYVCTVCGAAVIENEAHEYTDDQCVCGAYKPGTEQNPIVLTEMENTVENSGTVYYQCYFSGTHMSINSDDGEYKVTIDGTTKESWWGMYDADVVTPNPRMPFNFSIEGEGTLQINFEYPEGTMMNPAELFIGYNYATIKDGNNQGFYYNWTAPADGTLTLSFSAMNADGEDCGWFYVVNNMTTYAYGEMQWSDSDPVVNPAVVTVKAGDEIELIVNTYDPANMWSNPIGTVITTAAFECDDHTQMGYENNNDGTHDFKCYICGTVLIDDEAHDFGDGACVCGAEKTGSEGNPLWLYEQENTVENEDKLFYQGYFSNMTMTVLGEGDFKVEYNGQTFNSENGMISIPVSSPYPRMPVVFALEGNGTYQINFSFPEGHMENPAELNVGTVAAPGENTAAVPGNGTPYFYAWTAPMDGTLTINMVSGNFIIGIDNMTTGAYGDMQFASDGVTTFTVELNAGDEICVTVGTEDYTTANVKLTAAFEEKGAEFAGMTMSLGESLAVNFVIDVTQLEGDGHVAVITKTYADGTDPMTVKIPQSEWASYRDTRYYFTFAGVKAKEMTDEFTVIIYNAEGKQVSKTYTRTIEDYCRKQISTYEAAAKPDAERLALYVDILKYGAAAQTYFNYNVNKPATANLTAAQLAYGTQSADVTDIRVKGTGYLGATLSLVNEIQLNFVFSNAVANKAAYAVVTFEHYDGEAVVQKIEAADFQAYGTSGKYITVSGMKMADYLQVVTLTLYDANGNALSVTKDSVGAYVARMSDADPLYETVVKLGKSSLAYFK